MFPINRAEGPKLLPLDLDKDDVNDNQNKKTRGNPSRTASTQGLDESQPRQDNKRRLPGNRNTGLSNGRNNGNRNKQGSPGRTVNTNYQGLNPGKENKNPGNRRPQNKQSGGRGRQGQDTSGGNRRTEGKTNDKLNSRQRGTNAKQRTINRKKNTERIPNQTETTIANLGNAGSQRSSGYNDNSRLYEQGHKNQDKTTGIVSRNINMQGKKSPGGSKQIASQVHGTKRTNQLKEGSIYEDTFSSSDISPLDGYENKAGYPALLDKENCPNYPFCYWNPY